MRLQSEFKVTQMASGCICRFTQQAEAATLLLSTATRVARRRPVHVHPTVAAPDCRSVIPAQQPEAVPASAERLQLLAAPMTNQAAGVCLLSPVFEPVPHCKVAG